MTEVVNQLAKARQRLLDLTMRNRLLNFRASKARTLRIIGQMPGEVYDALVLRERTMEFLPQPPETVGETGTDEPSVLWSPTPSQAHRGDRFLQTTLDREKLHKRLLSIHQQARSVFEEQGYTVLFLALGFLRWTEDSDARTPHLAPLVLVPVEIERHKVSSSFKLRWTGEEIMTNISLQANVAEQGVTLPDFDMPEEKTGIHGYFEAVLSAARARSNWNIFADIYVDFFSFTKFVMYKDLDPKAWPEGKSPADHPLLRMILDPSADQSPEATFPEDEIDSRLNSQDLYHVWDADPSQIAVIEEVKAGRNLVVEGPPGTGKSQTITNVIAELLAAGRTVLFVSEKMAALEVVKSRLDQAGLGDFCLELHSRGANKKEFLEALRRSLSEVGRPAVSAEGDFRQLEMLKAELNEYARALREPVGSLKWSPFDLINIRERAQRHLQARSRAVPRVRFPSIDKCDRQRWDQALAKVRELSELLPRVQPVATHPWCGCEPSIILPGDEDEIAAALDDCRAAFRTLMDSLERLESTCAVQSPGALADIPRVVAAAGVLAKSQPVDRDVLRNPEWNNPSDQGDALLKKVEGLQKQIAAVLDVFRGEVLTDETAQLCEEYVVQAGKRLRILRRRYRQLRKVVRSWYKGRPRRRVKRTLADVELLRECCKLRSEIRAASDVGRSLFGSHWCGEESDPSTLRVFAEWVVSFRRHLLDQVLTERAIDIVSTKESRTELIKVIGDVSDTEREFRAGLERLARSVRADYKVIFGAQVDTIPVRHLGARLEEWRAALPRLQDWARFVDIRTACRETIAAPLLEAVNDGRIEASDVVACFEANAADELLRVAFTQRPVLARFDAELHERKIDRFVRLDRDLILKNRDRLAGKLWQGRPRVISGASPGSEAGILLGEFARKRAHKPIRKLMVSAGGLIQKIKPCFMMSPLSIAQFLDPRTVQFDVIVFDEASQVRPEDALGALLRGQRVVVMGDTRQLPPTSFFDHLVETGPDDEQEGPVSVAEVESILHQCKRVFLTRLLRWHYRSRHESLIAVSNQEFYDNRLLIYPSSIDHSDALGLHFMHVPNSVYDRGRSSTNLKEAEVVVSAVFDHFRKHPDESLGIGTFNIKQQEVILDLVDARLQERAEMEEYFASARPEHFFVKNLETIQGDERDVIFLSIGYGFDDTRRLMLNFGPLNQNGGERRLNVLITRARKRCVVFSNFKAEDLAVDERSPVGLRALKTFLGYAADRRMVSMSPSRPDVESPFEQSVYEFLREHGHEVRKQVGCAGFRVDLGVVDPELPGRYLLGVECDGWKYHSAPVARDRDRLRQEILESLGWRIYRVWSTDWYRNRSGCERGLLSALERARRDPPNSSTPPTRPATTASPSAPGRFPSAGPRQAFDNETSLADLVPEYRVCTNLCIPAVGELHEQPVERLAGALTQVVLAEGPVHIDEVARRIRSLWGLKRTGQRIQEAIRNAASLAAERQKVKFRGDFLWLPKSGPVPVRRRGGDAPARLDLICDEEIGAAAAFLLKHQFATVPRDLAVQVSRVLGIQATRDDAAARIEAVIEGLVRQGVFEKMPSGLVRIPEGVRSGMRSSLEARNLP